MRIASICCAGLLALAGCGSDEQKGREMSAEQVADEMAKMKMEPGQWEATNEILSATSPAIPADQLREMVGNNSTVSNCLTPEEAARPSASFLAGQQNSQCTYQDFSLKGGNMTGTISCTGPQMPGKMVMQMDGQYSERDYSMNMNMTAADLPGGLTMTIKARTTARRVGDCA
jgi:hypothetical protein